MDNDKTKERRFISRKFILLIVMFLTSLALGIWNPTFVGNAQVLFNFWLIILGLYFGGNVAEKYSNKKV